MQDIFKRIHLILGGGSNILLTNNFEGIVIKIDFKGKINFLVEDEDSVLIEIGAGENWHEHCFICNSKQMGRN